jgi:hypothetical protein
MRCIISSAAVARGRAGERIAAFRGLLVRELGFFGELMSAFVGDGV